MKWSGCVREIVYILFIFLLFMGRGVDIVLAAEKTILVRLSDMPQPLLKSVAIGQNSTGIAAVDAVLHEYGALRIEKLMPTVAFSSALKKASAIDPVFRWVKIIVADTVATERMMQSLTGLEQIEVVQPNRVFHLHQAPNDPLLKSQWALTKIQAMKAWELESGRSDVLVAVIDSGIDYTHPDLVNNIWINPGEDLNKNNQVDESDRNGMDDDNNGFIDDVAGWDFTDAPNYPSGGDYLDRDNDPMDEMGHGTFVAGIIGATANNSLGMAGLAYGCRLLNLRAMNANGYGEEDDVASAILYAVVCKAAVINMSWGDTFVTRLLDDVIRYAAAQNVVLVASAGNSRSDIIHYPSGFEPVISVGASNSEDHYASSFTNYGSTIDLIAPGQGILSTSLNARYDSLGQGTSFAAPHVSAAAALLLSQNADLTPVVVRNILTATAQDLGEKGWDPYYGAGRLDVYAALASQAQANVQITSPWLDDGFSKGPISIRGSAWTSTFTSYSLYYGLGHNPGKWSPILLDQTRPVIEGLLATWETLPTADSSYTVRLVVKNDDGSSQESMVRVLIDRTPPKISNVALLPMLDGDRHSVLIEYETDDLAEGVVFYRSAGINEPFREIPLSYRTTEPRLNFTQERAEGKIELKILARNGAGLTTVDDNAGRLYAVDLSLPPVDRMQYTPMDFSIPAGYLLNAQVDYNQNKIPELVIGAFTKTGGSSIQLWEYAGTEYKMVAAIPGSLVPRDIGDSNGNKKTELLVGYGVSTWLYENQTTGDAAQLKSGDHLALDNINLTPIKSWLGSGTLQYWGGSLVDVDGDEKDELLIRVQDNRKKPFIDEWQIWKWQSDTLYTVLAELPNPTSGENNNGVPHCLAADFDGDGRMEILFGDSDGDLVMYERSPSGFVVAWQHRMPLLDAISWSAAGDFDGDGLQEFIVGSHSDPTLNSEHNYDARHWCYRLFDTSGNNSYAVKAEWRFFGYESTKEFPCGVVSGDVDHDGRDEALITVYPDFYIVELDGNGSYQASFHADPIQSEGGIVIDSNHDGRKEFWISNGKTSHPWRQVGESTAPPVPVGIVVHPLDERSISLSWYAVPGADEYRIYRGTDENNLSLTQSVTVSNVIDTLLQTGQAYWYEIDCLDYEKSPAQSIRSARYMARPGAKPVLLAARCETERAVRLFFSEPLSSTAKDPTHYLFDSDLGRPSSCAYDKSGQEMVLSLSKSFSKEGTFTVTVQGLTDLDGTPMDGAGQTVSFQVVFPKPAPFLAEAVLLQQNNVLLTFSEPMQADDLLDLSHYDLGDGMQASAVQLVNGRSDQVQLVLTSSVNLGALGKKYLIRVHDIKSATGIAIQKGRGDAVQLVFSKFNLDDVYTYPNPYRQGLDTDGITFANLTMEAQIRIFTLDGKTLRILNETNGDGGLLWDGRDEQGRELASGIYIYRVSNSKETKWGKLAIVR